MKILLKKFHKPKDIDTQKDLPTSAQPPAVFRLSEDILISIFLFNVDEPINPDDWVNGYIRSYLPPTTPQLTTRLTSQVCRRWRIVALTCPALWSNIELSPWYFRWVQEMIQRAIMRDGFGRVSLTCFSEDALSQITPQLLSHTSSYRGMASREQWCLLINELASPTTPLESLSVIPANPHDWASSTLTPSLTLEKPGLKKLLFDSYFPIDITQPNLSSLTTFVIIQNGYSLSARLASAVPRQKTLDIQCALVNMPLLEELSVSILLWNKTDSIHSVNLPCLARLKLEGSYSLISRLLSNINFPLSCSLHITCGEDEDKILPTDDMISHIVTPVARNMAYGFTHNLRIHLSYNLISIEDLPLMPHTVPSDPGKSDVWSAQLQCCHLRYTNDDWKSIFDQMVALFHDIFQTTTHLTLNLAVLSYPADLIPRFLQPFTELVTINLNGKRCFEQFSLFKVTSGNEQGDFLLALRNVKVVGLFAEIWSLDGLIDFLAWRLERNKGLHTLDLYFDSTDVGTQVIDIKKRQLSRLQQLVADINFYHIQCFGNHNASLIKAVILQPTFGNAGGRCRLERCRDISNDEPSKEEAKRRKIFRVLGRWT